ncbi:MAG: hypothetical protein ABI867_00095 [Kofleriaceae bacterium]
MPSIRRQLSRDVSDGVLLDFARAALAILGEDQDGLHVRDESWEADPVFTDIRGHILEADARGLASSLSVTRRRDNRSCCRIVLEVTCADADAVARCNAELFVRFTGAGVAEAAALGAIQDLEQFLAPSRLSDRFSPEPQLLARPQTAEHCAAAARALDPLVDDPHARYWRALVRVAAGDLIGAADDLHRVAVALPSDGDAVRVLVRTLLALGRILETLDVLITSAHSATDPVLHQHLIDTLVRANRPLDALAVLERATGTAVAFYRDAHTLARIRLLDAAGNHDAALRELAIAARASPAIATYLRTGTFLGLPSFVDEAWRLSLP